MGRDTRMRMIDATIASLRRHGLAGTSFTDVLEHSGAARGAIYHHFPSGKAGMVRDALVRFGGEVTARIEALDGHSVHEVASNFFALVRPVVLESVEGAGCPVAAITTEVDTGVALAAAARTVFEAWTGSLQERLEVAGAGRDEARALSETLIIALEGSHVLCRALATITPFNSVATSILASIPSG